LSTASERRGGKKEGKGGKEKRDGKREARRPAQQPVDRVVRRPVTATIVSCRQRARRENTSRSPIFISNRKEGGEGKRERKKKKGGRKGNEGAVWKIVEIACLS